MLILNTKKIHIFVPYAYLTIKTTMKNISGFSKLTKQQKIQWLCDTYFPDDKDAFSNFISNCRRPDV